VRADEFEGCNSGSSESWESPFGVEVETGSGIGLRSYRVVLPPARRPGARGSWTGTDCCAEQPCRWFSIPPPLSHPPAAGLRGFIGRSSASSGTGLLAGPLTAGRRGLQAGRPGRAGPLPPLGTVPTGHPLGGVCPCLRRSDRTTYGPGPFDPAASGPLPERSR
jgi:hypothetical protein